MADKKADKAEPEAPEQAEPPAEIEPSTPEAPSTFDLQFPSADK